MSSDRGQTLMSALERLARTRIAAADAMLVETAIPKHGGTAGSLREAFLRQLLLTIVPESFRVSSGFIIDACGAVSPQLDLVLATTDLLPSLGLTADVPLVPCEAALGVVEVKSTLQAADLTQLKAQDEALNRLRPVTRDPAAAGLFTMMYVFAFESKVSRSQLQGWFRAIPRLRAVCVLNAPTVLRVSENAPAGRPQPHTITLGDEGSADGTLCFTRLLLEDIGKLSETRAQAVRQTAPYYLVGPSDDAFESLVREIHDL